MIKLKHDFAITNLMSSILQGTSSIDGFLKNARRIGAELNAEITEVDPEDPLRERNRIVGDAFEVFGEFFIKHKRTDDRVLISKFGRPVKDNGIDGEGIDGRTKNGSVFVQFKCYQEFDGKKEVRLIGKQLDSFIAESLMVLRERFPDGKIAPCWPRLLVITSAKGLNGYTAAQKYRGFVECFGINELRQMTCSPDFWEEFRVTL